VATATNCKLQDQAQTLLENRTEMRDLAITAERERIARDMHDTLGHLLSIMTAKADLALRLTDKDLEEARQEIKDIHLTGRQALKDVRRVIAGMENTTIANELGHARYLLETANIHVTLVNQTIELPASHQHALGMIIREATTNIVRHSNATRCEILLHQQRNQLKLTILDNGEGGVFAPKTGLLSMRERTERLSGEFTINYTKQEGTRLTVQLPLDADLTP
jgi:two-component system sensor histidine kinase DesK